MHTRVWNVSLGFLMVALGGCSGTADDSTGSASVEGTLQTVAVGNADRTAAHLEHFLETENGAWTRLIFDRHPELLEGEPGHEHVRVADHSHGDSTGTMRFRATGTFEGDRLIVEAIDVTAIEHGVDSTTDALIAASPRKVAVILANFSNNTSQPLSPTQVRDVVFGGAQSSNAYFKETSFGIRSLVGKLAVTGDVFGWYTLAVSDTPCNYSTWGTAAQTAAKSAGVDLTGYDHVIHFFANTSSCGWAGVGQVPGKNTWINGVGRNALNSSVISHELGHNFGSHHASTLSCTNNGARVSMSSTCSLNEYGNPFDVMGQGYRHSTAFNKGRMGFLEPENTRTVTADGTFTVTPLERKSTGIQALRIPIPGDTSRAYYVEFRQPFGFDNFASTASVVNGVLINRAAATYTNRQAERPELLDMVPSTTSFTDAALGVGKTFDDGKVRITVTAVSSTGADVTVDII